MPIDLDLLEKLEKEATPGPWSKAFGDGELWVADRDLICAMRNALPEMIAACRAVQAWGKEQEWLAKLK